MENCCLLCIFFLCVTRFVLMPDERRSCFRMVVIRSWDDFVIAIKDDYLSSHHLIYIPEFYVKPIARGDPKKKLFQFSYGMKRTLLRNLLIHWSSWASMSKFSIHDSHKSELREAFEDVESFEITGHVWESLTGKAITFLLQLSLTHSHPRLEVTDPVSRYYTRSSAVYASPFLPKLSLILCL